MAGHPTSLSLEAEFWFYLREIARERSLTLNELMTEIDATRDRRGLSSAARIFVLNYLVEYLNRLGSPSADDDGVT